MMRLNDTGLYLGPSPTVFERLQGNVYRQIESPSNCGTCEEEINYYMFSEGSFMKIYSIILFCLILLALLILMCAVCVGLIGHG